MKRLSRARPTLFESLESRLLLSVTLAPNARSASFTDVDGDLVTIAVSKGVLSPANFTTAPSGAGDILQLLDLSAGGFDNANLTLSVKHTPGGDGLVNIGCINSTGHDLGKVSVNGDLARIDAGDGATNTPGLASLTARSLGRLGLSTQLPGGSLDSNITGRLGALIIKSDIQDATLFVNGGNTNADGSIASITLGGSLIAGVIAATGNIGPVKIAGDILGGSTLGSGRLSCLGTLQSLSIGGSLVGATGQDSGEIVAGIAIGPISIAHDLRGGSAPVTSGVINSRGTIASVKIAGSLAGGSGPASGQILSTSNMGPVSIAHDIRGNLGDNSAIIASGGNLASLKIGGSLIGALGENSAKISAHGNLSSLSVAHDVLGGGGRDSAGVFVDANLGNIAIGGSLVGGASNNTGDILASSLGPISIAHDVLGGSVSGVTSLDSSALIEASNGSIASLSVGGSIVTGINTSTGALTNNASIRASDAIGKITVKGSLIGNRTLSTFTPVIISARGQAAPTATSDVALASLTVSGRVELALILAGYDTSLTPANGNAQITSISVAGDWIASSAIAGAQNLFTLNTSFGLNDSPIPAPNTLSRIASISIAGQLLGTPAILLPNDHFGFVARQILSLKIAGNTIPLNPLPDTDNFNLSVTNDFTVHEI